MSVHDLSERLLRWLLADALPLWELHGIDRECGGYFETLDFDPTTRSFAARGGLRRGRVVARQIYVFDAGMRLGWQAAQPDPVLHGTRFLLARLQAADGMFHTAYDPSMQAPHGTFSLYESAFYLFALARTCERGAGRAATEPIAAESIAVNCLTGLRQHYANAAGGFVESRPHSPPLQSNPHMHLLEAAVEWLTVATDLEPWARLAAELAELCITRFIHPTSGALHEYFDTGWRPLAGEAGRVLEPGHHFEWAWLLWRWSDAVHCSAAQAAACRQAALRLLDIGERWGVDERRGVVVNALWDDMTPKDLLAKLWPQTERIKAWCAMFEAADSPAATAQAAARLETAGSTLLRFLDTSCAGLWNETQLADGSFRAEPCKASSFYHIVLAIETLDLTLARLSSVVS